MTKSKLQIAILTIGLISTALGIWTMSQTPTMILSPLFLVGLYLTIALMISLVFGFFAKALLNSNWSTLTFAALSMTFICLTFYASQYNPSYKIIIPANYVGEVRLFVSNEKENDFRVNSIGIGYINQKTYKNGFRPIVIKGGHDISHQISNYEFSSYAADLLSFDYFSFNIPGKTDSFISFENLVRIKAIDTTRLHKK